MAAKTMGIKEIMKVLPHRYPFLLVDKILDYSIEEEWIIGQKNLTMNELFFQGHFPDTPIMPGVLILEALAQAGAVFIHLVGYHDKVKVLLNINNAKFRTPVHPGDVLILKCRRQLLSSKGGRFKAEAYVGEKKAAEADIGFALVEKENI